MDLAQQARLDHLHAAAEGVGRAALRAELRGQLALPAQLADLPGLGAAMGHRLLAEDVLAGQHGGLAHRHVPSLARGDDHRVDGLLRLQQLAVVPVDLGPLQLGAEALSSVVRSAGCRRRRWPRPCRPAAGPSRGSGPSARRSPAGPGSACGWPLLRPTPATGTKYGSAQAPMPAAARVFKSERRVICECWCMVGGSQEGTDGWDEETAGNAGRRQSPRKRDSS